jgi:SET domain-containing protein
MPTKPTPNILHPSGLIYCAQTKGKGRGIFAAKLIKKDRLIEHAPLLITPAADWRHLSKTLIQHYVFGWSEKTDEAGFVLGFGSLYNHSYDPNAYTQMEKRGKSMRYIALRDIQPHEEITINYNGEPDDETELWFKVK